MKLKAEKRVTIYEIARKAGCSAMTVSRALMFRRKENDRISKETAELIQQLARDMGYKPNMAARSLILKRTFNVGFHINQTFSYYNPLWKPLLRSLQSELEAGGYQLGFYYFEANDHEELTNFLKPPRRVDALITLGRNLSRKEVQAMLDSKIPCISLLEKVEGFHSLLVDDAHGGRLAAEYLYEKGFREVTLISRPVGKKRWNGRTDGFLAAAKKLGLAVKEISGFTDPAYDEEYAWLNGKVAPDFVRRLQKQGAAGRCVYCASDIFAQGLVAELEAAGVTVGKDISVVGYDSAEDLPDGATFQEGSLTTLVRPREEIGRTAAQIIIEEETEPVTEVFLPTLVERGSVKGGGKSGKAIAAAPSASAETEEPAASANGAAKPVAKVATKATKVTKAPKASKAPKAVTKAKAAPKATPKAAVKVAAKTAPKAATKAAPKAAPKAATKVAKAAKAPAKAKAAPKKAPAKATGKRGGR